MSRIKTLNGQIDRGISPVDEEKICAEKDLQRAKS